MLTLLQFHLWRKQSMNRCRRVALVSVTCLCVCVCVCVCLLRMPSCVHEFLQSCLHASVLQQMMLSVCFYWHWLAPRGLQLTIIFIIDESADYSHVAIHYLICILWIITMIQSPKWHLQITSVVQPTVQNPKTLHLLTYTTQKNSRSSHLEPENIWQLILNIFGN